MSSFRSEDFLLMRESFLEPTSLSLVVPGKAPQLLKQLPPRFDASGLTVTQHEAVATVSASDAAPGTVVGIVRPGYVIGDEVLRPAQVAVAG